MRTDPSRVPQIWQQGHVSLGSLWGLYSQYPYMPRLRDRRVLDEHRLELERGDLVVARLEDVVGPPDERHGLDETHRRNAGHFAE